MISMYDYIKENTQDDSGISIMLKIYISTLGYFQTLTIICGIAFEFYLNLSQGE